tara:strand:+ start:171 stop:515 length:345 start_codon:yes stop_codon:yes gene_type:complete
MAHKGIREFSGEELGGVALGQNGFKMISGATVECGLTSGYEDIQYFIALKAVHLDAELEARTVTKGDDLTIDSNGVAQFGGSDEVKILNGDIVYGAFDKVKVDSSDYVIAYIGK